MEPLLRQPLSSQFPFTRSPSRSDRTECRIRCVSVWPTIRCIAFKTAYLDFVGVTFSSLCMTGMLRGFFVQNLCAHIHIPFYERQSNGYFHLNS